MKGKRKVALAKDSLVSPELLGSYIRAKQLVPGVLPFSACTLWRKVRDGTFPKPVHLSERITAWKVAEVRAWLEERAGK